MDDTLSLFFRPRGVALIGASASPNKLSYGILRNLAQYGFTGSIYPVNPRYEEILGIKAYPDVGAVPDPVDLAVTVLPAGQTPAVLDACGQRGVRAVIIISGGFKEIGKEGAALEAECVRIARNYSMRLIGPNCVGTMDLISGVDTTFIQGIPARGRIGFISQSGAVGGGVVDYFANKQMGFSMFASLGNEADVTETDLIEYLADDPNTAVIAAYVEAIRDGRRFLEVASRVSRKKPIVMLKAGRTGAGARAVSSHTGSLAGSNTAYQAAFRQAGVIEASSAAELFEIAQALDYQPLPAGRRVAIATNAGGPAALASDSLAANGLTLEDLTEETRKALRPELNPAAQVANPVDMLGGAEPREFSVAVRSMLADPNVDAVLGILVPQALVNPADVALAIGQAAQGSRKPVLACFMGEASIEGARKNLQQLQIPMFVFPESTGRVLGAMCEYAAWLRKGEPQPENLASIDRLAAQLALPVPDGAHQAEARGYSQPVALGEAETRPLLAAYGISLVRGALAHDADEAATAAQQAGFPVALKIVSPDILHKSDAGGIRLNLENAQAVRNAYQDLIEKIHTAQPTAQLKGALVEAMAPKGTEVIVGMKRDASFGPLVMFGLGGIYVELFGDVAFRVAPVTRRAALEMIQQTRAGRLLTGFRGSEPADVDAVVDCILRVSQLAIDFPEIQELEVNPLRVFPAGQGALALDCRAILE
jgi:acetyltransferase